MACAYWQFAGAWRPADRLMLQPLGSRVALMLMLMLMPMLMIVRHFVDPRDASTSTSQHNPTQQIQC
jgi:hypothetical protein